VEDGKEVRASLKYQWLQVQLQLSLLYRMGQNIVLRDMKGARRVYIEKQCRGYGFDLSITLRWRLGKDCISK